MQVPRVFKIKLSTWLGFTISGVLLWLLIKQGGLEWNQILIVVEDYSSLLYLVVSMILFVLMTVLHSIRTRVIFVDQTTALKDISAYPSLALGNLYNCLLPGNLGEGVRAVHFGRVNNKSLPSTLAVLVVEKIIDALCVMPLLLGMFLFPSFQSLHLGRYVLPSAALILSCICLMLTFIRNKKLNRLIFRLMPGKTLRRFLFKIYRHFIQHCLRLWHQKTIIVFVLIAYAMFTLNVFQYFFILKMIKIEPPLLGIFSAYLLSLCMVFIAFIPSAPGNIGVAHYGIFAAMMFLAGTYGINVTPALKGQFVLVGISLHFSYFAPEILIGLFFLIKEHSRLFSIGRLNHT